jgi:hypothetical protein
MSELPIIQKTYDLILWYIPILNRLPRSHKFLLGDRIGSGLYNLLEELIEVRFCKQKLDRLEKLNTKLDILRYQTRLLFDLHLIETDRYEYSSLQLRGIGVELGGWIKEQQTRKV